MYGIALALFAGLLFAAWEFQHLRISVERQAALSAMAVAQHDALLQLVNEETGVRGFMATGDRTFLDIYYRAVPSANEDERIVAARAAAFPNLASQVRAFQSLRIAASSVLAQDVQHASPGIASNERILRRDRAIFDALRSSDASLSAHVGRELTYQRAQSLTLARVGSVVTLIFSAAVAVWALLFELLARSVSGLRRASLTDALTGCRNRRGARAAVDDAIRAGKAFGIMFLDLDAFKAVNDVFGHAAGDAVLRGVAARLKSELRPEDTVSRLGGDEFFCVVRNLTDARKLDDVALRVKAALVAPYSFDGTQHRVGCSIGLSRFPDDAASAEALFSVADRSMYAQKRGRDGRPGMRAPGN